MTTTHPGHRKEPIGPNSYIVLANHVFAPDDEFGRNAPARLQEALNAHRSARTVGSDEVAGVHQPDLWRTLERLARAEQPIADKLARFHEKDPIAWNGESTARRELHQAIVHAMEGALEHCEASAEAAGIPWAMRGLWNISAETIIRQLLELGWIAPPAGEEA